VHFVCLIFIPGKTSGLQEGTTTPSVPTDCRNAGCPKSEECQQDISGGSAHYVCMCRNGFERDADTGHCKLISKSGQCLFVVSNVQCTVCLVAAD